jgi:hypothetical protein
MLVNASPEAKSHAEDWDETIKRLARESVISFVPEAHRARAAARGNGPPYPS